MDVLMECGHTAQGYDDRTKLPVCVICIGFPGAETVVKDKPSLEGRKAKCDYKKPGKYGGNHEPVPSSYNLAFFQYKPDEEYDSYYCGCWGWD